MESQNENPKKEASRMNDKLAKVLFILSGLIGVFGLQFVILSFILFFGQEYWLGIGFVFLGTGFLLIGNYSMKYFFKQIQINIWGYVPPKNWGRKSGD